MSLHRSAVFFSSGKKINTFPYNHNQLSFRITHRLARFIKFYKVNSTHSSFVGINSTGCSLHISSQHNKKVAQFTILANIRLQVVSCIFIILLIWRISLHRATLLMLISVKTQSNPKGCMIPVFLFASKAILQGRFIVAAGLHCDYRHVLYNISSGIPWQ